MPTLSKFTLGLRKHIEDYNRLRGVVCMLADADSIYHEASRINEKLGLDIPEEEIALVSYIIGAHAGDELRQADLARMHMLMIGQDVALQLGYFLTPSKLRELANACSEYTLLHKGKYSSNLGQVVSSVKRASMDLHRIYYLNYRKGITLRKMSHEEALEYSLIKVMDDHGDLSKMNLSDVYFAYYTEKLFNTLEVVKNMKLRELELIVSNYSGKFEYDIPY